MFEINKIFICKVGWSEYTTSFRAGAGAAYNKPNFSSIKENVIYYIKPLNSKKIFLINEFSNKQNKIKQYKFIIMNQSQDEIDSIEIEIKSNLELMRLIIDFEACNEEYKRHFKLIKILK